MNADDDSFTHMQHRPSPGAGKNTKVSMRSDVPDEINPIKFDVF